MFTIFSNPGGMLVVSGGVFSGIKSFVAFNILNSFSEVLFGLIKSSDSVVSQLGVSTNLGKVVVDVII